MRSDASRSPLFGSLKEFFQHVHSVLDQLLLDTLMLVWIRNNTVDVLKALMSKLLVNLFPTRPQ
jgi:hypothetical protein